MPRPLICQRCDHQWNYKGKSDYVTSCPICKTSVMVKVKHDIR